MVDGKVDSPNDIVSRLSDELPTMMIALEKATQKSMIRPSRLVHHTNYSWALCRESVRSTTQRLDARSGAGFPFSEITPIRPRVSSRLRVRSES
jgi:hypothetical protein